jgi:hypothetical protein
MKKPFLLLLLALLSSCALVQRHVEIIPWPSETSFLYGEGDLDMRSTKEHFSGSFVTRMIYPDKLFFEVYGPFGQTIVHLEKDGEVFLLISGEERTTDESALVDRFGFSAGGLMDDLALKGERRETPAGLVTERPLYRVVYGHDRRGRRSMCWERKDGRLCLTFSEIDFVDR